MERIYRVDTENQISLAQSQLAVSEEVGADQTVHLLRSFSERVDYTRFDEILERVPDIAPISGDEL